MASPASDLREWIALLEKEGELVRISAEVDPDLEITEIVDRVVKAGGPALLFENPKGASHPLLINQFGTEKRMCMAFGVEKLDDLADKLGEILELQPPQGLVDKVRSLGKLKSIADSMPKEVSKAACQEIVLTGDDVNLDVLPIQRCWPLDPAPFITLPAVITKDQATGVRNVGMYRMQKIDRRSTFMHWQIHKDGRADLRAAPDGRIPVAVALGLDPVTAYSASAPLPKHIGELMVAGFLKGSAVQLVKCKTVDLEVPANAEIVLEGWVDRSDVGIEGPFGDHTGFYTPPEEFPIFRISAITMRRDAIYPSIVVGKPPAEDEWLAKATERIFLPAIRMSVPEIVDYDLPTAGTFHNCVIVSIRKSFPGPRAEGDARDVGARADEPDEVGRRRRRARRRARLRAGLLLRVRERRPGARHPAQRRPDRPARPRDHDPGVRGQDRDRRDGEGPRRGAPRMAARDRDEPRDPGPGRRALGRIRPWRRTLRPGRAEWCACPDIDAVVASLTGMHPGMLNHAMESSE